MDYCLQVFRLGMIHDENWVVYLCNVGSAAQSMFPCDQGTEDAYTREVRGKLSNVLSPTGKGVHVLWRLYWETLSISCKGSV